MLRQIGELPLDRWHIDDIRVEAVLIPFPELGVALVLRVGGGFQEFSIARWPTDIFRPTAAGGVKQTRIELTGQSSADALDLDRVLPAVAKIVDVSKPFGAGILDSGEQRRLVGIERPVAPAGIANAPADIAGAQLPQVAVGPTNCHLQHDMEPVETNSKRDLNAPHDGRL